MNSSYLKSYYFWIVVTLVIFVPANIFLMLHRIYWLNLLPPAIWVAYWLIFNTRQLIFLLTLLTPFSINYVFESQGFSVNLPTEPIMVILFGLFLLRALLRKEYDKRVLRHPLTIIILLNLFWILVTSFSSSMPLVSFKFFFARSWFLVIFYFLLIEVFKKIDFIKTFIWLYVIGLSVVVLITLTKHSQFFFTHETANLISRPFYRDHTVYGAVLALFIPIIAGFILKRKSLNIASYELGVAWGVLFILLLGIVFSYTRAAWVSIAASLLFLIFMLLRLRFATLLTLAGLLIIFVLLFWTRIIMTFDKNDKISSTNLKEHVESISNISTDASNSERINRWKCAIRMFKKRPVLGWGPGTYMFQYAPFQMSYEKTIISTNLGTLGNAHSEFLGPLAEQGLLGILFVITMVLMVIYKGMNLFYHATDPKVKAYALLLVLSLITYFTHGLMNNFLDSDKAAVPVWGFIGALVALDIYHYKKMPDKEKRNNDTKSIS